MEENIGFIKIFDFWFLMDLHVLECPEHDVTISGKCQSICDKDFAAHVAEELMHRISRIFIFWVILTKIDVFAHRKNLKKIALKREIFVLNV